MLFSVPVPALRSLLWAPPASDGPSPPLQDELAPLVMYPPCEERTMLAVALRMSHLPAEASVRNLRKPRTPYRHTMFSLAAELSPLWGPSHMKDSGAPGGARSCTDTISSSEKRVLVGVGVLIFCDGQVLVGKR